MLVEDVCLVKQRCTAVTVEFDDNSVADFFDEQVDAGLKPEQFGRIWVHTHPGISADPSPTDEETFDRCFGSVEWTVMFILAQGGETYVRLRFNVGPKSSQRMDVEVDYSHPFQASNSFAWKREFDANVQKVKWREAALRLTDSAFVDPETEDLETDLVAVVDDESFDEFAIELDPDNDEDWFNRLESDPLFLDWEDDECLQRTRGAFAG